MNQNLTQVAYHPLSASYTVLFHVDNENHLPMLVRLLRYTRFLPLQQRYLLILSFFVFICKEHFIVVEEPNLISLA